MTIDSPLTPIPFKIPNAETLIKNISSETLETLKSQLSPEETQRFDQALAQPLFIQTLQNALIEAVAQRVPQWVPCGQEAHQLPRSVYVTSTGEAYFLHNRSVQRIGRGNYAKLYPAYHLISGEQVVYRSSSEPVSFAQRGYRRALLLGIHGAEPISGSFSAKTKKDGSTRAISLEQRWADDLSAPRWEGFLAMDDLGSVLEFALPMAEKLSFAHENGLIHGDVKPENYLFRCVAGQFDIRICDLSHSSEIADEFEPEGFVGTEPYWSPEYSAEFEKALKQEPYDLATVTTRQHDAWALGITWLTYFTYPGENSVLTSFIDQNPSLQTLLALWNAENPNKEEIRKYTASLQPGWIQEPAQGTFEYVIWKLLQVEPKDRWTPKEALAALKEIEVNLQSTRSTDT